MTIIFFIFSNC